jgi:hypothetical protein
MITPSNAPMLKILCSLPRGDGASSPITSVSNVSSTPDLAITGTEGFEAIRAVTERLSISLND